MFAFCCDTKAHVDISHETVIKEAAAPIKVPLVNAEDSNVVVGVIGAQDDLLEVDGDVNAQRTSATPSATRDEVGACTNRDEESATSLHAETRTLPDLSPDDSAVGTADKGVAQSKLTDSVIATVDRPSAFAGTARLSQRASKMVRAASNVGLSPAVLDQIEAYFGVLEDPGWKKMISFSKVEKYFLQQPGSAIIAIKGVGDVDATVAEVWELMKGDYVELMKRSDNMFADGGTLEYCTDHEHLKEKLVWARFSTPPMITERDFTYMITAALLEQDKVLCLAKTVERLDLHPINAKCIRGVLHSGGYLIEPNNKGGVRFTYIVHVDPKGWVPTWVVNLVAADQADNISAIAAFFKQKNKRK